MQPKIWIPGYQNWHNWHSSYKYRLTNKTYDISVFLDVTNRSVGAYEASGGVGNKVCRCRSLSHTASICGGVGDVDTEAAEV
jgi:hypothetical protein